jgi:hypothetical protein
MFPRPTGQEQFEDHEKRVGNLQLIAASSGDRRKTGTSRAPVHLADSRLRCRMRFARSSSRRRLADSPRPPRLMKY